MNTRADKQLTRQLRPKWRSETYGIAALTVGIGLYLLVLLARAAFASPPIASRLQGPLLAAARPKVAELRHKFKDVWLLRKRTACTSAPRNALSATL